MGDALLRSAMSVSPLIDDVGDVLHDNDAPETHHANPGLVLCGKLDNNKQCLHHKDDMVYQF